jgi:hypothetical protein
MEGNVAPESNAKIARMPHPTLRIIVAQQASFFQTKVARGFIFQRRFTGNVLRLHHKPCVAARSLMI